MIGNLIRQTVTNSGIGSLTLGDALDGYSDIASQFPNNAYVFYTLVDGNNKEIGVGQFIAASNTLDRIYLIENIIEGTRYKPVGSPLTFSSGAIVGVSNSMESLTFTVDKWERTSLPVFGSNMVNSGNLLLPELAVASDTARASYTFPNTFKANTTPVLELMIRNTVADTGAVAKVSLEYLVLGVETTPPAVTTITANKTLTDDTNINVMQIQLGSVPSPDSVLHLALSRDPDDAKDTMTGNLQLIGLRLAFVTNKQGTLQNYPTYNPWS